nr:uncharacterized protein LOC109148764 isoform X2 [Ipomoea trifida]
MKQWQRWWACGGDGARRRLTLQSERRSTVVAATVEVGDGESDNPENLPDESDNPENSSHEVQLGDEVVQLVQVSFLRESMTNQVRKAAREDRAIQQPPTAKKQKTLGLKRQVKTKHVATRKYRTRSTVVFKSKFKGNLSEPIELD